MAVPAYAQSPTLERIKKTGEIRCAVTEGRDGVREQISMYYLQKVAEKNGYKIKFVKFPENNDPSGYADSGGISDLVKRSVAEGDVDFFCTPSSAPSRDYRLQGPYQSYALAGYLGHDIIGFPMCTECDTRPLASGFWLSFREDDRELGDFIDKTFSLNSDGNVEIMESVKLEHPGLFTAYWKGVLPFYYCGSDSGILLFLKSLLPDRRREIICRK